MNEDGVMRLIWGAIVRIKKVKDEKKLARQDYVRLVISLRILNDVERHFTKHGFDLNSRV